MVLSRVNTHCAVSGRGHIQAKPLGTQPASPGRADIAPPGPAASSLVLNGCLPGGGSHADQPAFRERSLPPSVQKGWTPLTGEVIKWKHGRNGLTRLGAICGGEGTGAGHLWRHSVSGSSPVWFLSYTVTSGIPVLSPLLHWVLDVSPLLRSDLLTSCLPASLFRPVLDCGSRTASSSRSLLREPN